MSATTIFFGLMALCVVFGFLLGFATRSFMSISRRMNSARRRMESPSARS